MRFLAWLFNDFVGFISKSTSKVVNFFKVIFKDPLKAAKDLGKAIKNNIIERFKSALDVLGFLGKAIKKLFSGDFSGALDAAKQAGAEFIDVLTGVDDTLGKTKEGIKELTSAVSEYTTDVVKTAKATVQLRKESELLEVVNQGLIETYDIQAEKLRQIRDDDRLTIEERIKANNDLKNVLDEQQRVLLANANKRIEVAQIEFNKDKTNQKARIELQTALNEKKGIEAQVTGFLSEQKVNEASLERELLDLKQSDIDAINERLLASKNFQAEQIKSGEERLQALLLVAQQENEIETKRLEDKRNLYKAGTQAYIDANNELLNFQQSNNQKQIELEKQLLEAQQINKQKEIELERNLEQEKINIKEKSFQQLTELANAESKLGKAIFIAKQLLMAKEMLMEVKSTLFSAKNSATKVAVKSAEAGVDVSAGAAKSASAAPFPFKHSFNIRLCRTSYWYSVCYKRSCKCI